VQDRPRNPDESKTSGAQIHEQIEVQTWSTHQSPVRLNVWDFGGQEIMRGTHRFFLTARSLYLLVLEDRREDDRSIYDWLEIIAQCGGDSPVIVVINKTDHEVPQRMIDEDALKRSHPSIVAITRTSCNAGPRAAASIADLRKRIASTLALSPLLTHVRDPIPQSWLRVKDAIRDEASRRFVLPIRDFQQLCEGSADAHGAERITDPAEQRAALLLLHDLGIVIAHGARDEARAAWREVSILDPNWLTQAIYSLLTRHVVRDQQGELRRDQLGTLLDPVRHPARWHELILTMMQDPALGLCLPITRGDAGRYLLPEALPASEPDYGIWPEDSLRFRFRFQYERVPAGMIPRLIVEAHRSLTDRPTYWRTGVVLASDGCRVLVRGEVGKARVEIYVAGPSSRRSALGVVRGYFDAVHRHYVRLKVTAKVPLPDQPEVDVGYEYLVQARARRGPRLHLASRRRPSQVLGPRAARGRARRRLASSNSPGPGEPGVYGTQLLPRKDRLRHRHDPRGRERGHPAPVRQASRRGSESPLPDPPARAPHRQRLHDRRAPIAGARQHRLAHGGARPARRPVPAVRPGRRDRRRRTLVRVLPRRCGHLEPHR
jgi:GTPase SAR1 family protein